MPVTVEIEFRGLCLYAIDENTSEIAVLLPDCRAGAAGLRTATEDLGIDDPEPHVGYVRFDLANLRLPDSSPFFPPGDDDHGPRVEGIHRFARHELSLLVHGEPLTHLGGVAVSELPVPDFGDIAPAGGRSALRLKEGMLSPVPPDEVQMRLRLWGGELWADAAETWRIEGTLRPTGDAIEEPFGSVATWTIELPDEAASGLALSVREFGAHEQHLIPLEPVDGRLVLKVANLCAQNPLEWPELSRATVTGDDEDFALLYVLLEHEQGPLRARLGGSRPPVPREPPERSGKGVEGCLPGRISVSGGG